MAMSQNLRFTILERDGFTCQYCGKKAPDAHIEVDHLVPKSLGGSDNIDNLVAACKKCNRGKAGKMLSVKVENSDIERRLQGLKERRRLLKACSKVVLEIMSLEEDNLWKIVIHWQKIRGENPDEDGNWTASKDICSAIRGLLAKHSFNEVLACVEITLARHHNTTYETNAIKYLYGVVRNRTNEKDDS